MTKENSPCNFEECGFNYTLALINGKYKMSILYCLFRYEIVRYNELKRFLSSISFKTLTKYLKRTRKRWFNYQKRIRSNSTQGRI